MKPGLATVAWLCTLGAVAASSVASWRTTHGLEKQLKGIQEQLRSRADDAPGRSSAGCFLAGQRADSPQVLAGLIAKELERSAATEVPVAGEAAPSASPPTETRIDPVVLAAANDVVDGAFESGRWDDQHQRELVAQLGAADDDPDAQQVMLRVAVGINQGLLRLEPTALAHGEPLVPSH